jgi:hypothetical protein
MFIIELSINHKIDQVTSMYDYAMQNTGKEGLYVNYGYKCFLIFFPEKLHLPFEIKEISTTYNTIFVK